MIFSCASDDNYVPIIIETTTDNFEMQQNSSIEINVLSNDSNVPTNGSLTVSNSQNATIEVLDNNNTVTNPSDDTIKYTPNSNFVGNDSFTYTLCNSEGSCSTETVLITVTPVSPVIIDLETMPYATLSEYNFYEGELRNLEPVFGVLPYDLNSTLFSDYAHKKRFVWMPEGSKAVYENDFTPLNFPVGAVLIKNFYYDGVQPNNTTRIIETRLMYKTESGWDFANYIWNESQTEATFTDSSSFVSLDWIEDGNLKSVNYQVPSRADCFTCHNKNVIPIPIGPKPQNLNRDYTYSNGISNQLSKWIEFGYLEDNLPPTIVSTVKWDDESLPLNDRVRSYVDINCAHCHADQSYCEYRTMRFAFNENDDDYNMGICVPPQTQVSPYTRIIVPGNINNSLLHFRISTIQQQYKMPLLGRTLQHEEGVQLIEQWINSLNTGECQ